MSGIKKQYDNDDVIIFPQEEVLTLSVVATQLESGDYNLELHEGLNVQVAAREYAEMKLNQLILIRDATTDDLTGIDSEIARITELLSTVK